MEQSCHTFLFYFSRLPSYQHRYMLSFSISFPAMPLHMVPCFPELLFGHPCWDHTICREWNSNSHHLCLTTRGYVACKMFCYDVHFPENLRNIYNPQIHGPALITQFKWVGSIALRWCSTTDISSAPDGTGFFIREDVSGAAGTLLCSTSRCSADELEALFRNCGLGQHKPRMHVL